MWPVDIPSNSFNFPCAREVFRESPTTSCEDSRPTVNSRQLSVPPGDLPSNFCAAGDLSRTSIIFTCSRETFQLSSNFCPPERSTINFRALSVWLGDLLSTSMNFPYIREIFCQLLSTFLAVQRLSVNSPCGRETLHEILSNFRVARSPFMNFPQISLQLGDPPSTSVKFPCIWENFRQHAMQLGDLP